MHSNFKLKKPSERKFGYTISIIFIVFALYLYIYHDYLFVFLIISSLCITLITFFRPSLLQIFNKLWFKLGILLGLIVSPIVMFLIYVITFFPIGLILRIFNKDLLLLKKKKSSKTYWIKYKDDDNKSMKNQF